MDNSDYTELLLPPHAMRLLVKILKEKRAAMSDVNPEEGEMLQNLAEYDSLEAIENEIPSRFWNE